MAHAKFPAEVLTPEGEVFSEEIEMLSTFTTVGSIGILANHEPLLARLEPTELRLYRSETEIVRFAQAEGYLQFAENRALVLVEEAIAPEQLDRATFETKLSEARAAAERAGAGQRGAGAGAARHPALRGVPRGRAVGVRRDGRRQPGRGSLRAQAPRLVHRTRLQPDRRRPHPARHQRAGLARARGPRAQLRPAAAHAGEPAHVRGRALPRRPARRDPVGAQPAGQRRGPPARGPAQRALHRRWSSRTSRSRRSCAPT